MVLHVLDFKIILSVFTQNQIDITTRLVVALIIGGFIGLERSYHGRPAGFRTHALVCLASALLMMVTVYQAEWFEPTGTERVSLDPTRLAQGIMTGIGFLGAGAIIKEGLTVRGLTTAASIWTTAAIGILIGVGLYFAASCGTILTLGTLSVFRWIEGHIASQSYWRASVRFRRDDVMPEQELIKIIRSFKCKVFQLSYDLGAKNQSFEYKMNLKTLNDKNISSLSQHFLCESSIIGFSVLSTGDE